VPDDVPSWLSLLDHDGAELWRVAVSAEARRWPRQSTIDELTSSSEATWIVLDHAGPAASRHALERSVALVGTPLDPVSRRRARAMTDAEIAAVIGSFADAARRVRELGRRPVIAIDDDGLLHRALSYDPAAGARPRLLELIAACAPCELCLTIEDLCPGGLDPSAGIDFARQALTVSSSSMVIATGGTAAYDPLHSRRKGNSVDRTGVGLASAAWLVGRLDVTDPVDVFGLLRTSADAPMDRDAVVARAQRVGLAGIVQAPRDTAR
jgi:hypothetical protein